VVNGQGAFFQRGRGGGVRGGPPRGRPSTVRDALFDNGGNMGVGGSNTMFPALEEPTSETSSMDGGFGGGSSQGQNGNGNGGAGAGMAVGSEGRPQTIRNIYVYSAPDEPSDSQTRKIRVPGGQDKHVNIIFLKTPSQSSAQQTEVVLPEQPQQRTIVYVLLKKGDNSANVMIRKPPTPTPSKPQVFFIRYKNPSSSSSNGNGGGSVSSLGSTGNSGSGNGFRGGSSGSSGGVFGNGAGDGGFSSFADF